MSGPPVARLGRLRVLMAPRPNRVIWTVIRPSRVAPFRAVVAWLSPARMLPRCNSSWQPTGPARSAGTPALTRSRRGTGRSLVVVVNSDSVARAELKTFDIRKRLGRVRVISDTQNAIHTRQSGRPGGPGQRAVRDVPAVGDRSSPTSPVTSPLDLRLGNAGPVARTRAFEPRTVLPALADPPQWDRPTADPAPSRQVITSGAQCPAGGVPAALRPLSYGRV